MATFSIGETVICSCEVKNSVGEYVDPATSMTITIKDKFNTKKIDAAAMTPGTTGKYHYDAQTATYVDGKYKVIFIATDGTRISIGEDTFVME